MLVLFEGERKRKKKGEGERKEEERGKRGCFICPLFSLSFFLSFFNTKARFCHRWMLHLPRLLRSSFGLRR
jgi:hypothetical protein